jgi:ABC-type nitrate/sulfonate/bicarbonate transport system substrate-binding protein
MAMSLAGCSTAASADPKAGASAETTVLRYQGSANSVVLPELAEALGYLGDVKLKWVGNTISGPQDIQSVATNQTDVGEAFAGAIVKLVTAGAPITAVVSAYGEDAKTFIGYYVNSQSPIKTARDLIGKKIAVNTLGAQEEAEVDTYLKRGGLSANEIKQVQLVVTPPNSTEEALRRGQVDVGALSGVLQDHAVAGGGLRPLFDDYSLFGSFAGGQYVFRNDFIAKNPKTVTALAAGIAKAIHWENTTPRDQVIAEFKSIISSRGRGESTQTLQYWKSSGLPGYGAISSTDFARWDAWLHDAGIISARLDASSIYSNKFNTYAKAER